MQGPTGRHLHDGSLNPLRRGTSSAGRVASFLATRAKAVSIPCGGARLLRGASRSRTRVWAATSQSPAAGHVFCGVNRHARAAFLADKSQSPAAGHVFCGRRKWAARPGTRPRGLNPLRRGTSSAGLGGGGRRLGGGGRLNPLRRGTSSAGKRGRTRVTPCRSVSIPCGGARLLRAFPRLPWLTRPLRVSIPCGGARLLRAEPWMKASQDRGTVSIPCGGARLLRGAWAEAADGEGDWASQSPAAGHVFCGVSARAGGVLAARSSQSPAAGHVFCGIGWSFSWRRSSQVSIPCGGARLLRDGCRSGPARFARSLNPLRRGTSSAGTI